MGSLRRFEMMDLAARVGSLGEQGALWEGADLFSKASCHASLRSRRALLCSEGCSSAKCWGLSGWRVVRLGPLWPSSHVRGWPYYGLGREAPYRGASGSWASFGLVVHLNGALG